MSFILSDSLPRVLLVCSIPNVSIGHYKVKGGKYYIIRTRPKLQVNFLM